MALDLHGHLVPRAAITAAASSDSFGVTVAQDPAGPRLSFAGGPPLRPVWAAILDDWERRDVMDRQGLETSVVSNWPDLFGPTLPRAEAIRWARLCNEELKRATDQSGGRLIPCAQVPQQFPEDAAAELRYAVSGLGCRMAAVSSNANGVYLGDPALEPLWEAAEELNLPLFVHPVNTVGKSQMSAHRLEALVGYPFDTTLAIAGLILGGVCHRHPRLRFLLAHGGGYLPWAWGRISHGYHSQAEVRTHAPEPPEAYLSQFWADSIVYRPAALSHLVEWIGADRVVLGTDYPFPIADADPLGTLGSAGLEPKVMEAVATGNGRRLLGMKGEDGQP